VDREHSVLVLLNKKNVLEFVFQFLGGMEQISKTKQIVAGKVNVLDDIFIYFCFCHILLFITFCFEFDILMHTISL